jgi:hypothetical protein
VVKTLLLLLLLLPPPIMFSVDQAIASYCDTPWPRVSVSACV